MGAWGVGNFENDSALDWVSDLIDTDNVNLISITLNKAIKESKPSLVSRFLGRKNNIIQEPTASEVIAAAEVLAAVKGEPNPDLPVDLSEWIMNNSSRIDYSLIQVAKKAVGIIKNESELRELWEESDELESWVTNVDSLLNRLT